MPAVADRPSLARLDHARRGGALPSLRLLHRRRQRLLLGPGLLDAIDGDELQRQERLDALEIVLRVREVGAEPRLRRLRRRQLRLRRAISASITTGPVSACASVASAAA
jgi:hypothetical protein